MLYALDVKNIPMHYIEADSIDEAVGIMKRIAKEKGEPFVLQTIYVKENFIRKER